MTKIYVLTSEFSESGCCPYVTTIVGYTTSLETAKKWEARENEVDRWNDVTEFEYYEVEEINL